ncbi:MAG: thioredoxin family protein [Bacteroidales bacterium]|nr:thioredoxin family protein [Bacteroidales bacterium]MCF8403313.1 thioredoxin family protein [Bacteroidales bacterium]
MQTEDIEKLQIRIKNELGVLLYFYNDDCAPCISLRPKVQKLMDEKFPKMKVNWINSKQSPEIPAAYGVFANPAILLFFDGKETRRFSKYVSIDELGIAIERYYQLIF